MNAKSPDAFRTISEVADWLGVNAHVLRFWESKFTQIKPVKRAGGRRYYRRADMELLGGIRKLLHEDGMTIKGAQKVLREQGVKAVCALSKPVDDGGGGDGGGGDVATVPAVEAPESAQAAAPEMPLFSHRGDDTPAPEAPVPGPVPEPAPPPVAAPATAPAIEAEKPAPAQPLPFPEALERLRPMQVSPELLVPIHARLVALRARMERSGRPADRDG